MNSKEHDRRDTGANFRSAVVDTTLTGNIDASLSRGLALVGEPAVQAGDLVVIKPNLTTAKSARNSGVTTPPDIVGAIIKIINAQQPNCRIRIVESDSDGRIEETFVKLGYAELCRHYANVETVDLGRERHYKIMMPPAAKTRLIEIPEILLEMNVFINVANLKRHILERLSGVWKNLYGLPSNHLVRMKFHPFLDEVLFDLNRLFWPDLSVLDARVALGGPGPLAGFPVRYNKLILSRNPLAADLTALALIGEGYRKVPAVSYAVRRCKLDPARLEILGDRWFPAALPFVNPLGFKLGRLAMKLRKLSVYLENLFTLGWMVGKGIGMGGTKFAGGGIQTLGTSLRMAKRVLTKLEVGEQIHG